MALGALFASSVMTEGFIPFVDYFVRSGFQNPYSYFADIGNLHAFPYSSGMLWIISIPYALLVWMLPEKIGFMHLFVLHIPIIVADVVIFRILCIWLKSKEKKILIYYFLSPVLLYINYIHGQLDVIPTSILFLAMYCLFASKNMRAFFILGLGIAIKSHLIAALPFFIIYLYVNKVSLLGIAKLVCIASIAYLSLTIPYLLMSNGYFEMVFKAQEQKRVFFLNVPYNFSGAKFLIAPAAYLVLLSHFASYKKINQDLFILIIGLVFTVLTTLVVPMPGWFYWSVPFLTFFYIKVVEAPTINYWILCCMYLLYFLFEPGGNVFSSMRFVFGENLRQPYDILLAYNIENEANQLLFTGLIGAMIVNAIWCYKIGIKSNAKYFVKKKPLLIGIGGDSGAGKSTFATTLSGLFGEENTVCVNGDDVHRWPRGDKNWNLFTHLNPRGNNLHTELKHAIALKSGGRVERVQYNHSTGKFSDPIAIEPNKFILFVGLHTYYIKRMRDIFDIKIFIDPDENLRLHWKLERDMNERGYTKKEVMEQIHRRSEDARKYIHPQRTKSDLIISYMPLEPITNLGEEKNVQVKVRFYVENSVDLEPLVECLNEINGVTVDFWHADDLETQVLEVYGELSKIDLNTILIELIQNPEEILGHGEIHLESGYKGLAQLVVLYYISEISKFKSLSDDA